MTAKFRAVFGDRKPAIAMVHLGALPGKLNAEDDRKIIVGIRPEHLEISAPGIDAKVSVVEPTGTETLVFARHGEEEMVAMFRDRHAFKSGETVTLAPGEGTIHVFDPGNGGCIPFADQD